MFVKNDVSLMAQIHTQMMGGRLEHTKSDDPGQI